MCNNHDNLSCLLDAYKRTVVVVVVMFIERKKKLCCCHVSVLNNDSIKTHTSQHFCSVTVMFQC